MTLVCFLQSALGLDKRLLGELLVGDVGHHRHRSSRTNLASANPIDSPVWRPILEACAGGIAQAFHATGYKRLQVTITVVAMRRQMPQKPGIGAAGLKQLRRNRIHFLKTVVAEDNVQLVVGIDQRPRHVVERDM